MLQVREEYRREFLGNVSHELKPLYLLSKDIFLHFSTELWRIKLFEKKYLKRAEKGRTSYIYRRRFRYDN
jgi:two-component system phosphate regulon sensor histidine kinase PhoR